MMMMTTNSRLLGSWRLVNQFSSMIFFYYTNQIPAWHHVLWWRPSRRIWPSAHSSRPWESGSGYCHRNFVESGSCGRSTWSATTQHSSNIHLTHCKAFAVHPFLRCNTQYWHWMAACFTYWFWHRSTRWLRYRCFRTVSPGRMGFKARYDPSRWESGGKSSGRIRVTTWVQGCRRITNGVQLWLVCSAPPWELLWDWAYLAVFGFPGDFLHSYSGLFGFQGRSTVEIEDRTEIGFNV